MGIYIDGKVAAVKEGSSIDYMVVGEYNVTCDKGANWEFLPHIVTLEDYFKNYAKYN